MGAAFLSSACLRSFDSHLLFLAGRFAPLHLRSQSKPPACAARARGPLERRCWPLGRLPQLSKEVGIAPRLAGNPPPRAALEASPPALRGTSRRSPRSSTLLALGWTSSFGGRARPTARCAPAARCWKKSCGASGDG